MRDRVNSGRDFAIALSAANVSCSGIWMGMLALTARDRFLQKDLPPPVHFFGALANLAIFTALVWAAIWLARRTSRGSSLAGQWLCLGAGLMALNAIRATLAYYVPWLGWEPLLRAAGSAGAYAVGAVLTAGALAVLVFRRPAVLRAGATGLLILLPLAPMNVLRAGWNLYNRNVSASAVSSRDAAAPRRPAAMRVLWLVFDEWDQRLMFVDRNPEIRTPELDELRKRSFYASRALPPGPETMLSMSSWIAGRTVTSAVPASQSDLWLRFADDSGPQLLSRTPTTFGALKSLGFRSALTGWHVPYCRLIPNDLSGCYWEERAGRYAVTGTEFGPVFLDQARSLVESNSRSFFGQPVQVKKHAETYTGVLGAARRFAVDRDFDLVLAHFPIPHVPFFYDRRKADFSRPGGGVSGYWDSLELVDRTVAGLRSDLARAGLSRSTALIITSDHPFRTANAIDGKSGPYIPFLLYLPDAAAGLSFERELPSILTPKLSEAILLGQLRSYSDMSVWFDQQSAGGVSR